MGWRYFATRPDGKGGRTILDWEVPLSDAEITDTLSGPGGLTGKLPVEVKRLQNKDGTPIFQEWGTEIWAESDGGRIEGGGILASLAPEGGSLGVDCVSLSGYPKDQPFDDVYVGIKVDPLGVVRRIWNHLQAQPDGNLGVVVDGTTSPVRIGEDLEQVEFETGAGQQVSFEAGPYKLNFWSTHDLGKEIDDLAVETPFDYHDEVRWEGDVLVPRVRLFYPRMGRRRTDLRFVLGENIQVPPAVSRDGESFANSVLVLGAGEGRDMKRGQVTNRDGRIRRVAVVTDDSIRSNSKAVTRAKVELAWRRLLEDVSEVTISDHRNARLGSFGVGDEILLQIDDGWVNIELWVRLLSITKRPERAHEITCSVERSDKMGT